MLEEADKLHSAPPGAERDLKIRGTLERSIELGLKGYSEVPCWAITRFFHYYSGIEGPDRAQGLIREIVGREALGDAALLFQQAMLRERFMRGESALEKVDQSLALAPNKAAFSLRASLRRKNGRTAEALSDCDAGLSLDRDDIVLLRQRCHLRLDAGDYQGALADAEAGLALGSGTEDRAMINLLPYKIAALIGLKRAAQAEEEALSLKKLGGLLLEQDLPFLKFTLLPEFAKRRPTFAAAVGEVIKCLQ